MAMVEPKRVAQRVLQQVYSAVQAKRPDLVTDYAGQIDRQGDTVCMLDNALLCADRKITVRGSSEQALIDDVIAELERGFEKSPEAKRFALAVVGVGVADDPYTFGRIYGATMVWGLA